MFENDIFSFFLLNVFYCRPPTSEKTAKREVDNQKLMEAMYPFISTKLFKYQLNIVNSLYLATPFQEMTFLNLNSFIEDII
jgi:hypothetical protein